MAVITPSVPGRPALGSRPQLPVGGECALLIFVSEVTRILESAERGDLEPVMHFCEEKNVQSKYIRTSPWGWRRYEEDIRVM